MKAMGYKIVHTADWHFYDKHKYSNDGSRLRELKRNCSEIVEFSIENKVDRLIIAGDIFHHYNPSQSLLVDFVEVILPAMEAGVEVRVILGQHDTNGTAYSLEHLHDILAGMPEDVDEGNRLQIFPMGQAYLEETMNVKGWINFHYVSWHPDMDKIIKEIKLSKNVQTNILVTHTGVLGSKTPSGYMMEKGYLGAADLKKWDYVALGDFHNAQSINDNIHYSGSPIRFRWDEKNDALGFNFIEIDGTGKITVTKVPLGDIPMIDWEVTQKDIDEHIKDVITKIDDQSLADAVLKIKVKGKCIDSKLLEFENHLYGLGARQVYISGEKTAVEIQSDELISGLSIIDVIKNEELKKDIEDYGLEIVSKL
jgi:exonuclease SbcD